MSAEALPEIIAHRGNASEFPENTLEALESAVALGVRYVEFDVQLTADRVPVLFHDTDLARVANRPDHVSDIAWSDLADYPVGETERFGNRYANVRPPGSCPDMRFLSQSMALPCPAGSLAAGGVPGALEGR